MALNIIVPCVVAIVMAAGAACSAVAESESEEVDEAAALAQAKVTLLQAIAAVERQASVAAGRN
jgi:hypothetical protein